MQHCIHGGMLNYGTLCRCCSVILCLWALFVCLFVFLRLGLARFSRLYDICAVAVPPFVWCVCCVSMLPGRGLGSRWRAIHDVAFSVTRALCVACAAARGRERQGDTAWFRSGMCDVGSLYNRAGLPDGGQWDECHPLHPPRWVMTTTHRYSCQVLLTSTVNTHTHYEKKRRMRAHAARSLGPEVLQSEPFVALRTYDAHIYMWGNVCVFCVHAQTFRLGPKVSALPHSGDVCFYAAQMPSCRTWLTWLTLQSLTHLCNLGPSCALPSWGHGG